MAKAKVVRNPNRGSGKEHRPTAPFVPEWQRMGVQPAVYENVQRDFQMLPKQKRPKVAGHSQQPSAPLNVPKQTRVGSMSSEEVSFTREFSRENARTKKPISYEEIPLPPPSVHSKQGIPARKIVEDDEEDFEEEELDDEEDEFDDEDEVELDDEEDEDESDEDDDTQSEASNYLRFKPGQYALLVRGEIVLIDESCEKMENVIESIVYNGMNGETVDLTEIMLIRCIPLKMGIVAME